MTGDGRRREARLDGRVVLVTGAGAGLGRAYALDLAARGARVVANDVDEAALASLVHEVSSRPGAEPVRTMLASVADWDGAAGLIDFAGAGGRLDAVINNAAIFVAAPAVGQTEPELRRMVEVNLLGSLFVGGHALRRFAAAGDGLLLNITSEAYLGLADAGGYAATKGGIVSMSYSWAREMRGTGVRVNVLAPRARTAMSSVRGAANRFPAPAPAAIAPVVAALLSEAGRAVTGTVLAFDGDRLAVLDRPRYRDLDPPGSQWTDERLQAALGRVHRPPDPAG